MFAVMTHGVFSGPALERLMSSQIEAIVVSNTIPQHEKIAVCPKIQVCGKTLAVFTFLLSPAGCAGTIPMCASLFKLFKSHACVGNSF